VATQHTRPLTQAMREALPAIAEHGMLRLNIFGESVVAGLARRGLAQCGWGLAWPEKRRVRIVEITEAGRAEAETLLGGAG
jgi:hypothetical protein